MVNSLGKKNIILLTSVGNQVSLVKQFVKAIPSDGKVIVSDNDKYAAGLYVADEYHLSPAIENDYYIDWLINLCKKESVKMVITLLSEELLTLEKNRKRFKEIDITLIGMPVDNVSACLDKRKLSKFCDGLKLKSPKIWEVKDINIIADYEYPLIAKKKYGKGSRGQKKLLNKIEAKKFIEEAKKKCDPSDYLIQEFLVGDEFGLDIINDLDRNYLTTFVRKKFAMRNGETHAAELILDNSISELGHILAERLKHSGLVDCDIIKSEDEYYLIDVNPRFGGGYLYSHYSGANIPALLISLLFNHKIDKEWLKVRPGILWVRNSSLVAVNKNQRKIAVITTGGHDIGMGHAMRQISIIENMKNKDYKFSVFTDNQLVFEEFRKHDIDCSKIDIYDKKIIFEGFRNKQIEFVLIDVYEPVFPKFEWISEHWSTTLIVSRIGYELTIYAQNIFYIGEDLHTWRTEKIIKSMRGTTKILSGRAFLLFRPEFGEINYFVEDCDKAILIAHGGSDPHKLTTRSIKSLEMTKEIFTINLVIGPLFHDKEINELTYNSKHNYVVYRNPSNLSEIMSKSTVAIINGGNIRYELCMTKTPYVALSIHTKQFMYNKELSDLGVGVNLGIISDIYDSQITHAVESLLNNFERRQYMKKNMATLFDMKGPKRLINEIELSRMEKLCYVN